MGGWGEGRALLEWRGEGGRGSEKEPPSPAELQHIRKELQKYTPLTHSEVDDDDSPLGANTLERIPSVCGLDSGSEGAGSKHEVTPRKLPHFSKLCGHTKNIILSPVW